MTLQEIKERAEGSIPQGDEADHEPDGFLDDWLSKRETRTELNDVCDSWRSLDDADQDIIATYIEQLRARCAEKDAEIVRLKMERDGHKEAVHVCLQEGGAVRAARKVLDCHKYDPAICWVTDVEWRGLRDALEKCECSEQCL